MSQRVEPVHGMVAVSDLIIKHPEVATFDELLVIVAMAAKDGARFLNYDIKPDYRDTPKRWEMLLENAFNLGPRYLGERQ
ncbi:MAG: sulfur relay protein DsrC [Hyphomicrobiaceae bacterium]